MFFHFLFWSWMHPRGTAAALFANAPEFPEFRSTTWWGWVGVEIFFVVSGYVISASSQGVRVGAFALNRLRRLLPGVIAAATVTLTLSVTLGAGQLRRLLFSYIRSLSFWPYGPWIDGVYWTLGVELSFYLLVGLLIAVRCTRWLVPVLMVVAALNIVVVVVEVQKAGTTILPLGPSSGRTEELLLLHHGVFFALGAVLWNIHAFGLTRWRAVAALLLFAEGLFALWVGSVGFLARFKLPESPAVPLVAWTFGVMIVAAAPVIQAHLPKQLTGRWPATLGMATYPLYLVHLFVGVAMVCLLHAAGVDRYVAVVTTAITMVAIALLITTRVEPAIRHAAAFISSAVRRRLHPVP